MLESGRNQLLLRYDQVIQKQAGYNLPDSVLKKNPNSGYTGSPVKLLFRFTYSFYDRLIIGLSGAKDAGEQFFKRSEKNGMDFYSGYISLQNTGILKQLTVGNFNVDFGQGLTLSSGISAGAIPGTGNVRRCARGIVPSQSTNEGNYLRGIAMVLNKWKFRLSLFYSNHKRDGNITATDTTTGNASEVSSFTTTGYHRTPAEIADKNSIRECIFGGNLNFRYSFLSVGFTGLKSQWSGLLEPKIYPYNLFAFRGDNNLNLGMDIQFSLKNTFVFGECSRSLSGGMAFLTGIQVNPDPRLMFALTLRDYERNYQDLLSNALGQNAANANEEGAMVIVNAGLAPGLDLKGYVDLYRFPWLKYRTDSPSLGSEYQLETDYTSGKTIKMSLLFRLRKKQLNTTENQRPVNILEDVNSSTLSYQTEWQVSHSLDLKTRFVWLQTRNGGASAAHGYSLGQVLSWKLPVKHISLVCCYSLFDTDSYNERIYVYESDVLNGYSVPAYSGKGIRNYLLVEWSPIHQFDFWIRYSQTWYADQNTVGTGLDLIKGDTKSEIELQIRLKF